MNLAAVSEFLSQPARNLIYSRNKIVLLAIFQELGQPVKDTGCPKCLKDALDSARKTVKFHIMAKEKKIKTEFRMKPGKVVFEGKVVEHTTITPAIAKKLQKERPYLFEEVTIKDDEN